MTARILKFPMERVRPPELNTPAEQAALKAWASDQLARIERGLRDLEQHQQDWQYRFSADFVRPEPPGAA